MTHFEKEYQKNAPLRIAACKKYYTGRPICKTIEEARKVNGKTGRFGNWIVLIKIEDGTEFYTITSFHEKWVKPGQNYGMWNELHTIEKFKRTATKP